MYRLWFLIYRLLIEIPVAILRMLSLLVPTWTNQLLPRERLWPDSVGFDVQIWFHAVSLGEAQVLWAVLKRIPEHERVQWLFTTSTPSGMEMLQKHLPAHQLRYLPVDVPRLYRKLLSGQQPPLVLTEKEFWPNLFHYMGSQAKITVINAALSEKSLKAIPPWRSLLSRMARRLDAVYARNTEDAARFLQLGTPPARVKVLGNIKYDIKVPELQHAELRRWFQAGPAPLLFASMSTDEAPLLAPQLDKVLRVSPHQRVLWVPRHLGDADLQTHMQSLAAHNPVRMSEWSESDASAKVVVLDLFGLLGSCFTHAQLALVGGSFNQRGGQNFLEPMLAGTPVMVGPNTWNFEAETKDALRTEALLQLKSVAEVAPAILDWLENPEKSKHYVACATQFLNQHRGAIAQTIRGLIDLGILDSKPLEGYP